MTHLKRLTLAFLCLLLWTRSGMGQPAEATLEQLEEQVIRQATDSVAPSVIRIETIGGLEKVGEVLLSDGPTTGLAVSEDGYILSSAFNFVGQPTSILVTTPSGKRAAAQIVARDRSRMLVLLKANSDETFPVAPLVPRDQLQVGQWSIALGRTLARDSVNVSVGIVSATNRIWGKAIQTDSKISPANYGGPLIDIQGRVIGILVPLSPQGQGNELAGADWYDSGIGFAIPLVEILPYLDQLKAGQDLHAGILGVTLKGKDIYADPPVVAAVQPKSPAAEAGIKPADKIIQINGHAISRHAQLKHALGPLYAGDEIQLVIMREGTQIETTATLTDKLTAFEQPFLGILPLRGADAVTVRHVYADSPAAAAGLQAGDRITAVGDQQPGSADELRIQLANYEIGDEVSLTISRQGAEQQLKATLGQLPVEIPDSLPAASVAGAEEDPQKPATGKVEIKLPEEQNECTAYVPDSYHSDVAHGLVVWLHAPGAYNVDQQIMAWKSACESQQLILLAPSAADPDRWDPSEVDVLRTMIEEVLASYNIDRSRVVVMGHQAGASIAYLLAFAHRDLVRGLVPTDAAMPRVTAVKPNDPVERLSIYSITPRDSRLKPAIEARLKQLEQMKYPLQRVEIASPQGRLNADERGRLLRWIDSLDML
jgi:serine protease Do